MLTILPILFKKRSVIRQLIGKFMRKILNSKGLLLFLILTVAACSKNEIATPTAVLPLETETAVSNPTAIPSSTPVPTATSTPIPTPAVPMIDVADQPLTDDGELQIGSVIAPEDGWLVLYAMADGELGDVLAFTAVSTGLNPNITVTIDPQQATPTLAALLHQDLGERGEFEFPDGPDEPLEWESARIATTFALDFQLSEPLIEVSAQAIGEDGLLQIDSILLPEDGWLAIHAEEDGRLTEPLGVVPLTAGLHENVLVAIPWREGTPTLVAILYVDNGRSLHFDYQAEDVPMQVNGESLTVAFAASYPPDIFVLDQPLVDGTFEVERVISNGPGWLVAYFDDDGEPGLIIGSAPLADGLNEQIKVEVLQTAVTPILHLRLHEDNVPGDDFDFPRVDQPVFYEERLPNTVTFSTTQGNYLIVEDQLLSDSGSASAVLSINLVVVDVPVWVAIEADDNGKRGDILGFTAVSPGINRNIAISIDPALATETVYVTLYLNADEPNEFDPTNADVPLQRNRSPITVPFFLLEEQ
ncbi:hypothetical protein MNBD_CHLOROFLEXI01-4837 [hydrothermal vent metagenome]|uniref:DUF7282 domain-containing protein n=1 Tax=hydrothermal vent metagenome TaxID=652676 RepID=A0A3B0VTU8_9ZZZZ